MKRIAIVRHPIYAMLLPIPVLCFVGALLTDLAYLGSGGNLFWLNDSSWLLVGGLLVGMVAAIVLLIEVLRRSEMRVATGWAHLLLFYAALIVELVNTFVHNRDGWTAVAGTGITLSIIGAVLVLIAAWLHRPAMKSAI